MRTYLKGLVAIFCFSISSAYAIFPDSGWYWNKGESGRGFNLEIQNNLLFISAFAYSNGQPIWYVSGGPMGTDRTYSGRLTQTSNGQCFGCAYSGPAFTDVGAVTVTFSDETHAVITLLGQTISLERQDFANYTVAPDALYGEWSATTGEPAFPVYFGDRVSFSGPLVSSGVTYASGNRTGDGARIALGRYAPDITSWIFLVDSSTSYYQAYNFRFSGLNRIEGQSWTYLKTGTISGPGLYFVAHRTKSQARIKGGNAPGVTKSAPLLIGTKSAPLQGANISIGHFEIVQEENNRFRHMLNQDGPLPFDIRIIQELETALKASLR